MRHVIMVGPNHRRPRNHGDFLWQEAEVINSHVGLAGPGERCLLGVAPLRSPNAEEGEGNSQEAYDNFGS